jgi:hypothetical protein
MESNELMTKRHRLAQVGSELTERVKPPIQQTKFRLSKHSNEDALPRKLPFDP